MQPRVRDCVLLVTAMLGFTGIQSQAVPAGDAAAAVVQAAHAAGNFSGVVLVLRDGRVESTTAVGEADRSAHTPITPDTVFRLASLTKQVTALLVMQQVERGKLRLDQPVENFVAIHGISRGVTVRQLLQHISGLRNPSDGPDDVVPPFYLRTGTAADLQRGAVQFCSDQPKRAPGGNFEYNNCDYLMLAAVLEKLTGLRYPELVQREVIQPLGLTSWSFEGPARGNRRAAVGYDKDGKVELPQNAATYGAAGALYGSAPDVAKWDRALLSNRLLSPASTEVMFRAEPKLYGEALGSWSYDLSGTEPVVHVVERQGEIGGTRCLNLLVQARQLAIVILSNTERADLFNTYSRQGLGYALLLATTGAPGKTSVGPGPDNPKRLTSR